MDAAYEAYCLADPLFYDSPTATRGNDVDFAIAQAPPPPGWEHGELDDWLMYRPQSCQLPGQGWKIHASACLDEAEEILETVWGYCIATQVPFKFIRSRQLLFLRNAKNAHRGGSGKFITIYPTDEAQFERILNELGALLKGRKGPYILSDLRWGEGPLYVRYGGVAADRFCIGPRGELEPAIEDATGRLVPDRRGSIFEIPDWVTPPDCLAPHIEARDRTTVADLPYEIESAIHFSNGGGLYSATDKRSGEQVVLKEARPYAGLAGDGDDAVTRLGRERDFLERLAGLEVAPAVRDYFTLDEHHFLALEFIEGESLNSQVVERYPLTYAAGHQPSVDDYASWAVSIQLRVEEAVEKVHARGIVLGDIHPSNILVRPDGRVVLIDLEVASDAGEQLRPTLADPGFVAPRGSSGLEVDRHALACLRLYLFLPLTTLLALEPRKAEQLAAAIAELFPVPPGFLTEALETIAPAVEPSRNGSGPESNGDIPNAPLDRDPGAWPDAIDSMAEAILSSATPGREDRLFPGDIDQFAAGGGLNIGYGAAGTLYALDACGHGPHPECEEWLVRRATDPVPGTPFGFYDGLHGVAHVLERLGRRSDALRVLHICIGEMEGKWEQFGLSLFGGLAGAALNLLHFAEALQDSTMLQMASEIADLVASRMGGEDDVAEISGGEHPYAGLLRGSSGPALMFLRLYEHSGDDALLDLAATALRQDLRRCVTGEDGSLQVNEGWRLMPYLASGSVGIGMVLDQYLAYREDEGFVLAAKGIHRAAEATFYIEPGLFYGRAGMILYLARRDSAGEDGSTIADHVARLTWHSMRYRGMLAFPGEFLLRLSMDLASGTAGVMLALAAALGNRRAHLPFLPPAPALHASELLPIERTPERG
ncbi:MAG: class III lanthionine synthetase LanKC [Solirubrobacterales bacterium]